QSTILFIFFRHVSARIINVGCGSKPDAAATQDGRPYISSLGQTYIICVLAKTHFSFLQITS
ncbi:Os08g0287200, partial [Oryza sativa Japonica Group]